MECPLVRQSCLESVALRLEEGEDVGTLPRSDWPCDVGIDGMFPVLDLVID